MSKFNAVFASLTAGASFNKRKHHDAISLFSGKDKVVESVDAVAVMNPDASSEERINELRNRLAIKVKGYNCTDPITSFEELVIPNKDLKKSLLHNIELSMWKEPTAIQMQAIPALLEGRDVLAAAPTGSGKTAAYLIPVLSLLRTPRMTEAPLVVTPRKKKRKSEAADTPTSVPLASNSKIRALILVPTKELADQIYREANRLTEPMDDGQHHQRGCKFSVINETVINNAVAQQGQLSESSGDAESTSNNLGILNKFDMLISTPLRLVSMIKQNLLDLSNVEAIILDEADKLFEMDSSHYVHTPGTSNKSGKGQEEKEEDATRSAFLVQVDEILSKCTFQLESSKHSCTASATATGRKQLRALFSATMTPFVTELASTFLHNMISVRVGAENSGANTIDQKLVFVGKEEGKMLGIRQLIANGSLHIPSLLFTQSKERAKEVYKELKTDGLKVDVMHADRSVQQREQVIQRFRSGETWILVCTDLMSRGIDFMGVKMVINYDLPQSPVSYIHRIGRTGRGGNKGEAITYFTETDIPRLRSIANVVKLSGCDIPEWMFNIKQLKTKEKRKLRRSAPVRYQQNAYNSNDKKRKGKKGK